MTKRQSTAPNSGSSAFIFRGNYDEPFPDLSTLARGITLLEETEINGKTFQNVYKQELQTFNLDTNEITSSLFFYNKEFGVVGFQDFDGKMWELQNISIKHFT